MLAKCLNPRCAARFRYLGEGRHFRLDFSEASRRKQALLGGTPPALEKERPVEHFWLCESCAPQMTIQFSEAGEVRLVSLEGVAKKTAQSEDPAYNFVEQAS
jgi:hypothetical protein